MGIRGLGRALLGVGATVMLRRKSLLQLGDRVTASLSAALGLIPEPPFSEQLRMFAGRRHRLGGRPAYNLAPPDDGCRQIESSALRKLQRERDRALE
jgi:hypothetical protein